MAEHQYGRIASIAAVMLVAYVVYPSFKGTKSLKRYTTGLVNPGNFCYANSTIQALCALDELETALTEAESSDLPWVKALHETLATVRKEDHETRYTTTLLPFLRGLETVMNARLSYAQQDAHEFLVHIIDLIEENSKAVPQLANPFKGTVTDVIKCTQCSHEIRHEQPLLVLERQPGEPLLAPQAEFISDYRCENCNSLTTIEKKTEITSFPSILAVHINRTFVHSGQAFRNNQDTAIPTQIGTYKLKSIVNHRGYHSQGHYTCARKKRTLIEAGKRHAKNWWQISDEAVKEETENQAVSRASSAYLLFYEKKKIQYAMKNELRYKYE